MKKEDLLKQIAETGYNIGFGAKVHFATFDIVDRVPGAISFLTLCAGIIALASGSGGPVWFSSVVIVLGILGLYVSFFNHSKDKYGEAGSKITRVFNELKSLYFEVKSADGDICVFVDKLKKLEGEYYDSSLNKQIFGSQWYAHYKFFWEHQIEWVDEQKHFKFWRDKVPLSLVLTVVFVVVGYLVWRFDLYAYLLK